MSEPNPQLVEAEKTLTRAKDAYANAIASLERQFVSGMIGRGELADAKALRNKYGIEVEAEEVVGHEQPVADLDPAIASELGSRRGALGLIGFTAGPSGR